MVVAMRMIVVMRMMALVSGVHVAPAVERVDEAHVVDTSQVMQVPQRHGVYFPGMSVLPDGFFVNVRDRLHLGIEPRLQNSGKALMRDGRLFEIHLAVLGG